jgi:hypothetical protein
MLADVTPEFSHFYRVQKMNKYLKEIEIRFSTRKFSQDAQIVQILN